MKPLVIPVFAALLCFSTFATAGGEVLSSDINRDGTPDSWTHLNNGRVEKQEIDMNFDGHIDTVYIYEFNQKVREEILDTDYNGRMDNWRFYDDGELVQDHIDSDGDGRVDMWFYIDRSMIYKLEKDTNGNGKPDVTNNY